MQRKYKRWYHAATFIIVTMGYPSHSIANLKTDLFTHLLDTKHRDVPSPVAIFGAEVRDNLLQAKKDSTCLIVVSDTVEQNIQVSKDHQSTLSEENGTSDVSNEDSSRKIKRKIFDSISVNPRNDDSDADGLSDFLESRFGLNPNSKDSDEDGMPDGWELDNGLDPLTDDTETDQDGDGLTSLNEYTAGTDPWKIDSDGDEMPDGWEMDNQLNPIMRDSVLDPDSDGLNNLEEYRIGTDPQKSDTDNDKLSDRWEVENGLSPINPDSDGDGMPDGWELFTGYDELQPLTEAWVAPHSLSNGNGTKTSPYQDLKDAVSLLETAGSLYVIGGVLDTPITIEKGLFLRAPDQASGNTQTTEPD
ncbi:MAG: hypothetical protein VCD00_05590 [Candidatus Hydrogenedentota bacterium]